MIVVHVPQGKLKAFVVILHQDSAIELALPGLEADSEVPFQAWVLDRNKLWHAREFETSQDGEYQLRLGEVRFDEEIDKARRRLIGTGLLESPGRPIVSTSMSQLVERLQLLATQLNVESTPQNWSSQFTRARFLSDGHEMLRRQYEGIENPGWTVMALRLSSDVPILFDGDARMQEFRWYDPRLVFKS
jgi:hypothetical protein